MGELHIDLGALGRNLELVRARVGPSCVAAPVVKANAYGCGLAAVAGAFSKMGARDFFVATLMEALELRTIIDKDARIYMLGGFEADNGAYYEQERISPVLNTIEDICAYRELARGGDQRLPAAIHVDTGMKRLGLTGDDRRAFDDLDLNDSIDVRVVMSHFASADEAHSDTNARQNAAFKTWFDVFGDVPKSLANSSGIFRSNTYHYDMVRPGMCLYGLNPTSEVDNQMHNVVSLNVPILQVQTIKKGQSCGYNETYRFDRESVIATVALGYADGFLRSASNNGALYWKGMRCPIRGRVSMDTTILDVSHIPENQKPQAGEMMEVLGKHQSADDLASDMNTIGYEVLTSLGRRHQRTYKD